MFWIFAGTLFHSFASNFSCKRICSKGNIRNSPLPHTLKRPSTFYCWYCGCRMCWRYTLTLSLSLVFLSPVSPIYSSLPCSIDYDIYNAKTIWCEVAFQFKSIWNLFKGVVMIYQEIVFTSFVTTVKRTRWNFSKFYFS